MKNREKLAWNLHRGPEKKTRQYQHPKQMWSSQGELVSVDEIPILL